MSAFVWVPASAALLIFSFPPFSQPWCAWLALIPWLRGVSLWPVRKAFGASYLLGLLFFLGSIPWLIHVTFIGWAILCAVLAIYFGLFGMLAAWSAGRPLRRLLLPAAWVALEFGRTHIFTGFGWNLLSASQTPWLPVIQLADLTGAWGISFVLVLANVLLVEALATGKTSAARARAGVLLIAVMAAILGYGTWRFAALKAAMVAAPRTKVAVVQGNIPQDEKWDESLRDMILQRYKQLTQEAARQQPQLIVWPETAVPDYLWLDETVTQAVISSARAVKTPLLVGAPMGTLQQAVWRTTNSAALLDPQGVLTQRHDKLHLVPFGEFVPFERQVPWLRELLPTIGNFSSGNEFTVFKAASLPPFSVLICFEDVFPELARAFVRHGAQWLLVITNDAWFGPTPAAYQHAQASLMRAVELRVPLARAANTGWSGCFSAAGETLASVRSSEGKELFVPGTVSCELALPQTYSLYRAWGDWWAWTCLVASGVWLGWLKRRR